MNDWRTILYPLGFLSAIPFGARFIVQWLQSEKAQKCVVPRSFWFLSLIGNILLALHTFFQIQFHICLVQACNAVISWRNLNLMQTRRPSLSLQTVILFLIWTALFVSFAFALQDWIVSRESPHWFRNPIAPWQEIDNTHHSFLLHAFGTVSYLLFSSRFWIQWWMSEKAHTSELPIAFWWISLCGSILSIVYFLMIGDSVNLVGPLFGIIPYIRNLMLIYKTKPVAEL